MQAHEVVPEDILIRSTRSDQLLELALLHFERLSFDQAISFAVAGGNQFLKESRFQDFLKCVNIRIRIAAERGDQESVGRIKDELQELLILQGIQLNSSTHYSFALCAFLRNQVESAEKYLLKAIELARLENSEDDLIRAKIAMSSIYKAKGRLEESVREADSITEIPIYWKRPDYRISAKIIQIGLLLQKKDPKSALALCESCLEDLKTYQSVYLKTVQLYNSGRVQKDLGNLELARTYFNLAKSAIDPKDLTVLYQTIDSELRSITTPADEPVDLSLNISKNIAFERSRGSIEFGHQFILIELLRSLMKAPGETMTKADLARELWAENYSPSQHDNKIYATVKRLRDLIEPNDGSPTYILRSKTGYTLNRDRTVRLIS